MSRPSGAIDAATLDSLRELMGEEFDDLVNHFLEDTESLVRDLVAAVPAGDAATLYGVAHSLKSSAANLGALRLSAQAVLLEAIGDGGTTAGADTVLAELVGEFSRVRDALTAPAVAEDVGP